jgi:hypothetical protein
MTEAEWLACADPQRMLSFVRGDERNSLPGGNSPPAPWTRSASRSWRTPSKRPGPRPLS